METIINNKKSTMLYIIENDIEAGMVLNSKQVKEIINGTFSIAGAYMKIENDKPILFNCNSSGGELQTISLLLHKKEIRKIKKYLEVIGQTLVPISIYRNARGFLKVKLGFAKGRKKQDKRQYLKEKDFKREIKN